MKRSFTCTLIAAAAMAVFTAPVMAKGKIKAKSDTQETVDEDDGDKVEKATKVEIYFRTCKDARAAGYSRMRTGQPGYARHLDRDNDGIACSSSGNCVDVGHAVASPSRHQGHRR